MSNTIFQSNNTNTSFEDWLFELDRMCMDLGLQIVADLNDQDYLAYYEAGKSPQYVLEVIEEE